MRRTPRHHACACTSAGRLGCLCPQQDSGPGDAGPCGFCTCTAPHRACLPCPDIIRMVHTNCCEAPCVRATEVEEGAGRQVFDLSLTELGPYRVDVTRSGRLVVLGGRKGHLAMLDWHQLRTICELQVLAARPRSFPNSPVGCCSGNTCSCVAPMHISMCNATIIVSNMRETSLHSDTAASRSARLSVALCRSKRQYGMSASCTMSCSSQQRSANTCTFMTSAASRSTA